MDIVEEVKVQDFMTKAKCIRNKLILGLSEKMGEHIIENINQPTRRDTLYRPWWMGDPSGSFTVKFSYNMVRRKIDGALDQTCMD